MEEYFLAIGLAKGSNSEHPLPYCQGSHDVSWLHSDREKDCGLNIPLTSTAKFQLERSLPLTTNFSIRKIIACNIENEENLCLPEGCLTLR